MKSKKLAIIIFAVFAVLGSMLYVIPVKASPTTYYVPFGPPSSTSFQTIQQAVNYPLLSSGDTIIVQPGTYNEYVTIDNTKSGITLQSAAGPLVTFLDGSSPPLQFNGPDIYSSGVGIWGANDVTIEGFTIRNFQWGYGIVILGGQNNKVIDNIIEYNGITSYISGIGLSAAHSNIINDNIIQFNGWDGIFIDNGVNNEIKKNTIFDNRRNGIELHIAPLTKVIDNDDVNENGWFGLYADGYSWGLTIEDNHHFDKNGDEPPTWWGPPLENGGGIFVISGSNIIKGNKADDNLGDGIIIQQGYSNWVEDNHAFRNARYGIAVGALPSSTWGQTDYNHILRNDAKLNGQLLNGADVYWDQWGTNNHWHTVPPPPPGQPDDNKFGTSDPSGYPVGFPD